VDLPVRLSAPSASPVSVAYATVNSSATASTGCNFDYVGAAGTLTFAPGETTKTVRVEILHCPTVRTFRSFTLNLNTPVNATIARASARVSIVESSTVVEPPTLSVRDATVDEKDGLALVSVLLGGPDGQSSNSTVTVGYATQDGSATAGNDYTASAGTLSFAPGQTVKTIAIPIADDADNEPAESFTVSLSDPVNATITGGTGTVVIGASDAPAVATPGIPAPPDTVVDSAAGYVVLVVRLSAPATAPVSVAYTTQNVTAVASTGCNFDYVGAAGTLNFA